MLEYFARFKMIFSYVIEKLKPLWKDSASLSSTFADNGLSNEKSPHHIAKRLSCIPEKPRKDDWALHSRSANSDTAGASISAWPLYDDPVTECRLDDRSSIKILAKTDFT